MAETKPYAMYGPESNSANLGKMPAYTAEQADLEEIVDDLFTYSDQVTNSILSAIHAKSKGDPYWLADQTTGIWRQANEAEKADMIAAEEATRKVAVAEETAGEIAVAEQVEVVAAEERLAEVIPFPERPAA